MAFRGRVLYRVVACQGCPDERATSADPLAERAMGVVNVAIVDYVSTRAAQVQID